MNDENEKLSALDSDTATISTKKVPIQDENTCEIGKGTAVPLVQRSSSSGSLYDSRPQTPVCASNQSPCHSDENNVVFNQQIQHSQQVLYHPQVRAEFSQQISPTQHINQHSITSDSIQRDQNVQISVQHPQILPEFSQQISPIQHNQQIIQNSQTSDSAQRDASVPDNMHQYSGQFSSINQTVNNPHFSQNVSYNANHPQQCQAQLRINKKTPKEMIQDVAQRLIAEMNAKRKSDAEMLQEYKKALDAQVNKTCSSLENTFHNLYEFQGEKIQRKIHELLCVIDRCTKLESELREFNQTLNMLFLNV